MLADMKELSVTAEPPRFAIPGFLRLMRPANIVTAYADILAGAAAAGALEPRQFACLLTATTGLYGGGVVLNDVFDASLDAVERPERPIPSGAITIRSARLFGGLLLTGGVAAAFFCSTLSGLVASATALTVLLYDAWGKHQNLLGPLNMGLCRGLNLLLGMTVAGVWPGTRAALGLVTLCYIAGVTALSRGEVRGGTRTAANISLAWLVASFAVLAALAAGAKSGLLWAGLIFVILFVRLWRPFRNAMHSLEPKHIGLAIKTGVLSLILLDAVLAALYGGVWFAAVVLLLYIPATLLAKLFAVT
jgi:4-hydroxybenzoate polyprenyltransferase